MNAVTQVLELKLNGFALIGQREARFRYCTALRQNQA